MTMYQRFYSQTPTNSGFSPKAISFYLLPGIMLGFQFAILLLSIEYSIFPEADDWKSIVGTCAEIIAGLYGITMAGYTFFLSRIDALTATDYALDYLVGSIKSRFKYLIWFITLNVLMTLLTSIILMYCPIPTGENFGFLYRLFCNEFLLFLCFSIALILYYSILVIAPNSIPKEAARQKKRLDGWRSTPGSAVEFIFLYDQIQQRCNAMLPPQVLRQIKENKGNRFELTMELLDDQYPVLKPMLRDLIRVHRYYECVVNCSPMSVSQQMCLLAKKVLSYLEQLDPKLPMNIKS